MPVRFQRWLDGVGSDLTNGSMAWWIHNVTSCKSRRGSWVEEVIWEASLQVGLPSNLEFLSLESVFPPWLLLVSSFLVSLTISFMDFKLKAVVERLFLSSPKRNNLKKYQEASWGDHSLRKVLAMETLGPEFHPRTHVNQNQSWWHALAIHALGKQRQADAWGLLSSQSKVLDELPVSERPCLKNQSDGAEEEQLSLTSSFHVH